MRSRHIIYIFIFFSYSFCNSQELSLLFFSESEDEETIINNINYKKDHPNVISIKNSLANFKYQLYKRGYIDAEISRKINLEKKQSYSYKVSLNKKYNSIYIEIPDTFSKEAKDKLFNVINKNNQTRIDLENLENKLYEINNFLANQGKPFTYSEISEISKKNDSLIGKLTGNESNTRNITHIEIRGYDKFPKSYIRHYLNLKEGQIFNKQLINEKVERIENLSFSESTRKPEVLFQKDSTTVFLYLKKRNSNNFDGYIGFATNEETNNLEFNGYLNLQLENNFNSGEKLNILYRNDGEQQLEFDAKLEVPYLFNTPLGIELNLNLFKRDSTYTNTIQSVKANYQLNPNIKINTGYYSEISNNLQNENIISTNEDFESKRLLLGGDIFFKRYRTFFFKRNSFLKTEIGIGHRKTEIKKEPQQLYKIEANYQYLINNRNAIFIRNSSSFLNSDNYLNNELPRLGGINTIRGFEENSINSNLYSSFQLEYQYLLSLAIYAHTITDITYLETPEIQNAENLISLGFGLGLQTKVGNLRLMFANGKTSDQNFDFNNTKVHLQLSATF
ncbi:outer membrane protein assembly factor BamA [Mesonia algae]|uniref:Outer membrane protein assembly factor BamA n=1 Tax=Mesonia algae TaxID=213248 RepID=A0A2W7JT23_9FLAO|nr:outer membrane protein assembly factor BamA [Mesonia algae]